MLGQKTILGSRLDGNSTSEVEFLVMHCNRHRNYYKCWRRLALELWCSDAKSLQIAMSNAGEQSGKY